MLKKPIVNEKNVYIFEYNNRKTDSQQRRKWKDIREIFLKPVKLRNTRKKNIEN